MISRHTRVMRLRVSVLRHPLVPIIPRRVRVNYPVLPAKRRRRLDPLLDPFPPCSPLRLRPRHLSLNHRLLESFRQRMECLGPGAFVLAYLQCFQRRGKCSHGATIFDGRPSCSSVSSSPPEAVLSQQSVGWGVLERCFPQSLPPCPVPRRQCNPLRVYPCTDGGCQTKLGSECFRPAVPTERASVPLGRSSIKVTEVLVLLRGEGMAVLQETSVRGRTPQSVRSGFSGLPGLDLAREAAWGPPSGIGGMAHQTGLGGLSLPSEYQG